MTLALINQRGSGKISVKQVEELSHLLGQRLSVLYEFNSPEFFDKAVFSTLVGTLREEGYISDSGDAVQEHTLEVYNMLSALMTPEVKLTIESVSMPAETSNQLPESEAEDKSED